MAKQSSDAKNELAFERRLYQAGNQGFVMNLQSAKEQPMAHLPDEILLFHRDAFLSYRPISGVL